MTNVDYWWGTISTCRPFNHTTVVVVVSTKGYEHSDWSDVCVVSAKNLG